MRGEPVERGAERRVVREAARRRRSSQRSSAVSTDATSDAELGLESRRVADQIAGMDLEEPREQLPRLVRQVRARPFSMSDRYDWLMRLAELGVDRADELGLRQLAAEPAKSPSRWRSCRSFWPSVIAICNIISQLK